MVDKESPGMVTCSKWLPKTRAVGYSRKNPHRRHRWERGIWRNIGFPGKLEKEHVEILGSIKKEMEFPGVFTKTYVEFPYILVFDLGIHQGVLHNFLDFAGVKTYVFSKGKVTNLKKPGVFFRKRYISFTLHSCLEFFWNSPILMKWGRNWLTCPPPGYQDQAYLAWFSPDVLYTVISQGNLPPFFGEF